MKIIRNYDNVFVGEFLNDDGLHLRPIGNLGYRSKVNYYDRHLPSGTTRRAIIDPGQFVHVGNGRVELRGEVSGMYVLVKDPDNGDRFWVRDCRS